MSIKTMEWAYGVRNLPPSHSMEGWLPRVGRSVVDQNFEIVDLLPLAIDALATISSLQGKVNISWIRKLGFKGVVRQM
jgi:hypothetical protein